MDDTLRLQARLLQEMATRMAATPVHLRPAFQPHADESIVLMNIVSSTCLTGRFVSHDTMQTVLRTLVGVASQCTGQLMRRRAIAGLNGTLAAPTLSEAFHGLVRPEEAFVALSGCAQRPSVHEFWMYTANTLRCSVGHDDASAVRANATRIILGLLKGVPTMAIE